MEDKDGLDVLRLLRFADTDHLAGTLTKLAAKTDMYVKMFLPLLPMFPGTGS